MSTSTQFRQRRQPTGGGFALIAALPAACLAGLLACSQQREVNQPPPPPAEAPEETASVEAAPAPEERAPDPPTRTPSIDSGAMNRLIAAVEPLERRGTDLSHTATVEAFRALAGALAALPASDSRASSGLTNTAERLASSPETSLEHADLVREGLETSLSAFEGRAPPAQHEAEYRDALQNLQRSVRSIDAETPLLQQQDDVAQAFRSAANLVAIAGNAAVPFASPQLSVR